MLLNDYTAVIIFSHPARDLFALLKWEICLGTISTNTKLDSMSNPSTVVKCFDYPDGVFSSAVMLCSNFTGKSSVVLSLPPRVTFEYKKQCEKHSLNLNRFLFTSPAGYMLL